jgi:hypothetical protein
VDRHPLEDTQSGRAQHRPDDATPRAWRRALKCASNGCVEVAMTGSEIAIRDSKRADSPILTYDATEWRVFIEAVKNGEFDLD